MTKIKKISPNCFNFFVTVAFTKNPNGRCCARNVFDFPHVITKVIRKQKIHLRTKETKQMNVSKYFLCCRKTKQNKPFQPIGRVQFISQRFEKKTVKNIAHARVKFENQLNFFFYEL